MYSHIRTIKGVKIIALGIIILSSTSLLVISFGSEISKITTLLGETNDTVILTSNNGVFTEEQKIKIDSIIDGKPSILNIIEEQFTEGLINSKGMNYRVPVHLVNMAEIISLTEIPVNLTVSTQIPSLITDDLNDFVIGDILSINLLVMGINVDYNEVIISDVIGELSRGYKMVNSGMYIDYTRFLDEINVNMIQIQFKNENKDQILIDKLKDLEFVEINDARPEAQFLIVSADQIILLLLILQTMISLLVILNIWNLFNQLLYESKYDIRVLLSIGYDKNDVRALFIMISMIMGISAFLLSTIISYLLVNIVMTILAMLFSVTKLDVIITGKIILFNMFNGFVISVLGSLYPVYKEVSLH